MGDDGASFTSETVTNWIANLPHDCRTELDRLRRTSTPLSTSRLRASIDEHLCETEKALGQNEFVDLPTARETARLAHRLVDRFDALRDGEREIALLAVAYFVSTEDAEDDFSSPVGFDDDLQVIRAACHHLGIAID